MALPEKHFFIKRSTIPGAGKGLFTRQPIPKNTRILQYKGRITTWKIILEEENLHPEKPNRYVFYVIKNHVIDAMNYTKALARYANDAKGLSKIKGIANNCMYIKEGKKVFMETIKDIPKGGEILISYGKEYWDVIKSEIRQALKQKKKLQNGKEIAKV